MVGREEEEEEGRVDNEEVELEVAKAMYTAVKIRLYALKILLLKTACLPKKNLLF
jgi:hypothetical protein